jgi:uncharacterized membrane protein YbhN (UPF0104 family)
MKLQTRWSTVLAAVWLAVILVLFTVYTHPAVVFSTARFTFLVASALSLSPGLLIFGGIWTYLVNLSVQRGNHSRRQCFSVSLLSLAGLLTPMNIGTDVLRSLFGKTYLGISPAITAAASIATRESKLHVALALLPAIAAAAGMELAGKRMAAVFAATAALAFAFYFFRSDMAGGLAGSLRLESLAGATRELNQKLGWRTRVAFYFFFALGFAFDWEALRLCFMAFGLSPDLRITFAAFGILFFLSRTPVIPLGIGLVETGGFALLRALHVPTEQAGALVIAHGILRVAVPSVLALFGFVSLLASQERKK